MPGSALPLRALAVFEAAARLGSFRSAAQELALTPSAVSHQVRLLEAGLEVRLFERVGRGVTLSAEGRSFFESVGEGFDILRRATAELAERQRSRGPLEVVRLRTPPSFAGRWLLPRLPALLERHSALDIRVAAEGHGEFDPAAADLAIVYGDARQWQDRALPLLEERIQPLCAPGRAAAIASASDLLSQPLIATRVNLLSWSAWFRRQGLPPGGAAARLVELDPSDVAIEAATNGLGVVLESDLLAAEELAAGRLVAPLPALALSVRAYWLAPPDRPSRPGAALLRNWLIETAAGEAAEA